MVQEKDQAMKKLPLLFPLLLLLTVLLGSCAKNDGDGSDNGGTAKVDIRLTDGPAHYDAIWLDIREVVIITDKGQTSFELIRPGLYNLLTLKNGVDELLISAPVPVGTISQIRLILGNNNSIIVDGNTYPLNTPSAQESGLKLNLHETLVPGRSYVFWLDFDAGKSIVQTGNGQYKLKPVIRAYTGVTNGRIEGYVLPAASMTTVYATRGSETYTAIPAANGYYRFSGLPSGTYEIYFDAEAAGFLDVTLPNIQVSYGVITDLGIRTMVP